MHEFARAIALLQDEGVLQEFTELLNHVDVGIVGDAAREFPQLALLSHQVLPDLFE